MKNATAQLRRATAEVDDQPLRPTLETAAEAASSDRPIARRLSARTAATETLYSNTPLVTAVENKKARAVAKEKAMVKQKINKAAVSSAIAAIKENPELANGDEVAGGIVDASLAPHISHDIRHMASYPIIFCNSCGKWARDNQHSKLKEPCEEIKRGTKCNLKLLQHDVIPVAGAKLPLAAKSKAGRKKA